MSAELNFICDKWDKQHYTSNKIIKKKSKVNQVKQDWRMPPKTLLGIN